MAPVVAPTTPPPSLPRVQSIQCPNIIRPKRKSMLSSDDSFDSADEQDNSSCLGSPIRLTPVPFSLDGTTPATPRRAISISRAAPWAPKRKSTRSSSTYSPHFPVLQPFSRRLDYKTPEGVSTLTSQGGDRDALIGRISKLETLVRELQSELAAHKAGIAHYSATRPVPRTTRRAVNAKCTRSRPLPITADSVFD
jgi:hypothetical protein